MDQTKILYSKYLQCAGVSIDTRKINLGDLFFALKGPNFDGNKYAEKALAEGAAYAVVDDPLLADKPQMILVDNVLTALQEIATHHREQFNGHVLAITGSNGKTTTKELVYRVLATTFKVHCTVGNLNNHIGVPLTLLVMDLSSEIAIIEMGANHLGEIANYCEIAQPTHGVITNLGTAHIGEFGGRENLIRAKSELFEYLRKNEDLVFINNEDEVLSNMAKRFQAPILFPANDFVFQRSSPYVQYVDEGGKEHNTHLVGKYNFMNASAAMAIGKFFGVIAERAHGAIDSYAPDNNRSQVIKLGSNTIILDAYNANPDSTNAALENLTSFGQQKKIAMLGDMKELGSYSEVEHKKIFNSVEGYGNVDAYYVGEEYQHAIGESKGNTFPFVNDLISFLEKENPISNSVVLIKGSRSMTMEKLIQIEKIWN